MDVKLSANIRAMRKERKMTQEQLAEMLGVTVGAVSKWESGASTPDLKLIVEMADFFETSVDGLLGYEWHGDRVAQAVARLKALRNEKRFAEATIEAEKDLQKYPNSFDVAFHSAVMFSLKGLELGDKRAYNRSLALYERALELIGENTNKAINEWSIQNNIASVYQYMGQTQKALERLKKNNVGGLNDGEIGYVLAVQEKRADEALPYLSDALLEYVTQTSRVLSAYANAYQQKGDLPSALAALRLALTAVDGLRKPGAVSYMDCIAVQMLTGVATLSAASGDLPAAREALLRAKALATAFDRAPTYGFANSRFFHGDKAATAFNDFGATAMEGVEKAILNDEDAPPETLALWKEIAGDALSTAAVENAKRP